jgi:phosphomannomutase
MKNKIRFGTDGWRGIIGFDFTEEKIKIISAGICKYLKENNSKSATIKRKEKKLRVVIGYDTRFLSNRFAKSAAQVFAANDINTYISDSFITTPVLSTAVIKNKADLGVMITASHNPFYYNGYKVKGSFGGSATMDMVVDIETEINNINNNRELQRLYLSKEQIKNKESDICFHDFTDHYKRYVLNPIDTEIIKRNFDFTVLLDPMFGSGQGIFKEILQNLTDSKIFEIHNSINTSFDSINPEPIGNNLNDAINTLKNKKISIALCLDGDGDRIGAIGENGNFVSSHHIFAIVLDYLIRVKKVSGKVVKTISTSSIIDRICKKNDLELITKPVGFKYINEEILNGGIIMGGEESGGLWIKGYIPERDGIMMGLVLLEIMSREKKSINEILKDIYNKYGFFVYRRFDYECDNAKKKKLKENLNKGIPDILKSEGASSPVVIDGYKYYFNDGSWIMIRASGTEAVVRIYAESDTNEKLDFLHELGKSLIDSTD